MQDYIEFINLHPIKSALFVALLVAVITFELRRSKKGAQSVGSARAVQIINEDGTIVIDIRSAADFKQGHIVGAKNLSVPDIPNQAEKLCKNKDAAILICCKSGMQSGAAANQFKLLGYTNIYTLSGGIQAWQSEHLPLERGKK